MIVRLTPIVIFLLTSVTGHAQSPVNLDDALEEALQTEKTQEEKRRSVTQLLDPGQLEAVLASRLDEVQHDQPWQAMVWPHASKFGARSKPTFQANLPGRLSRPRQIIGQVFGLLVGCGKNKKKIIPA